jgi:type IV secretion system protein VirB10
MMRFLRGRFRQARDASSVAADAPRDGVIKGERATLIATGARSLQSRISSLLAAGLMISVGAGMLTWYYAEALSRPAAARTPAQAALPSAAGEGMALPTFGAIGSLRASMSAASAASAPSVPAGIALPSRMAERISAAAAPPLNPLLQPPLDRTSDGLAQGHRGPFRASSRQQVLDRRLSGDVFADGGGGTSSGSAVTGIGEAAAEAVPLGGARPQTAVSGPREDPLQTLLRPDVLSATRAQIFPTQRLLLPKGTFIDCTLETAIDSTLPGMTACVTATDTFGADGAVVLLERGTKLIGETRGEVRQGQARVFVVWTEARTPSGVAVQLDSPGTDALGRAGLDGEVNRHFWQRFGAAALVSTIDGVVQSEVQSSSRGGTVVLDPTASEDVLTDILRSTVSIPPTIRVRNGARIQVLVARDVDFRPVYELEPR